MNVVRGKTVYKGIGIQELQHEPIRLLSVTALRGQLIEEGVIPIAINSPFVLETGSSIAHWRQLPHLLEELIELIWLQQWQMCCQHLGRFVFVMRQEYE